MDEDFLYEKIRRLHQVKTLCDHCGNESLKDLVGQDEIEAVEGVFMTHRLYRCTICNGILLERTTRQLPKDYKGSKQYQYRSQAAKVTNVEQLWPSPQDLPIDVPERIQKIYSEARIVRRSPSSFVVQIGRALEAVTKDKKAEGKTLNDKLKWMVNNGLLPQVLGEMGHVSRVFRNWGAHDAETDVGSEDVEIIDEFFRAIIEYVYIAPTKVSRVQELVKQRQKKA